MIFKVLIAVALGHMSVLAADQDRWVWGTNGRYGKSDKGSERIRVPVDERLGDRGPNRFPDNDIDRYEVKEPTTTRPSLTKPQNDELDAFNDDPRYGPAGDGGFGDPNGFPYPDGPGGFGGGGGFAGGYIPRPPIGNPANGILVGPGGPTGVIGRPKGNPANGILVGPGGPTGVIGRPYPGLYPGGPGGHYPGGPGQYPGGQGFLPGGQYPGQFPGGPGQYPNGAGQYPGGSGQYPLGGVGGYPGQFPGGFTGGPGGFPGQLPGGGQYPGSGQYPGGGQYPLGYPGYDQDQGSYPDDGGFTPYNNNNPQFDDANASGRRGNKDKTKNDKKIYSILKSA